MTKIFINPGHDIDLDSGAVNPNTGRRECDVARDAGKLLACYLQTAGCEVRTLQMMIWASYVLSPTNGVQIYLCLCTAMLLTLKLGVQKRFINPLMDNA